MTTMKTQNPLGYEKESKLLVNFAIPCIISMLVTSLYNIVDQIFIGQGIGMLGNAATNIAFPLSTTCTALSLLLGIGSATNFSLHLGAGEKEKSARYAGNGIFLMAVFGLCLFLATTLFLTPMLKFFGATTEVLPYARQYTRITAFGFPFLIANTGMSKLILADGSPRYSMISMLIGAIVNTILDPIFIFGLHLGMTGAALATIISQFVSCIWVLSFLFGKKTIIKIRKEYLLFDKNIMKKILGLGFTPFFMSSTEGILQVAFNRQLLLYGGDLSVSAMTILLSMSQILSLPMEGIAQGAQPIISYNFGAKKYDRVKETIKITIKVALTYSIIGVLLMEAFPQVFVSLFANNTQLIQLSYQLLRIYIFGFIIMGAFSTFQQTYNALGCGKNAFFFAFFRKIILLIPLIYLLPFILPSYGVYAVVLAEPISDLMTTILNGIYFKHFVKKTLA